jgi:hypothetical protein
MTERLTGAASARTKNMVLRLDPELAERLAAIAVLVEARRKDKRFRRLLEDSLARHQRLLDLLRDEEP